MCLSFCTGCEHAAGFPPCAVAKITSGITLKEFLTGRKHGNVEYPVCHKNAVQLAGDKITVSESCDSCNLCKAACVHKPRDIQVNDAVVLKNCSLANIALSLQKTYAVGSEIKAEGNSRQKRIDLVLKKPGDKQVLLIKILTGTQKLNFYLRSYQDIAAFYGVLFPELDFQIRFLMPRQAADPANSACITLYDL